MNTLKLLLTIVLPFVACSAFAQLVTLSGRITNGNLEPLALVSIQAKGQKSGSISNESGNYSLQLEPGNYTLVISMIGYKPQLIEIALTTSQTQNIILEEEVTELKPIEFKVKVKDRSEEIIRQIIQHKEALLKAAGSYSEQAYIKAVQENESPEKKKKKKQADTAVVVSKETVELQRMAMAEIVLKVDVDAGGRIKEERTGVAKRGNAESLFFLSTTEGNFNIYNNQLSSRVLSEVPFVGPISYSGLVAYKYKMMGSKKINGVKYYTISFSPRQLSNATVTGELVVMDSSWQITSAHFTLPAYHLPEYDQFEVKLEYGMVSDTAWMLKRQEYNYFSKSGKSKLSGQTVASFSDIEINKTFPPKHFGVELSATTQQAYNRDSSFWEQKRTVPLTQKEIAFIRYKDSAYRATHTNAYLDSMEAVTNKVTWQKLLYAGQPIYDRHKQRQWMLPSLVSAIQPFQFGGARISPWFNYSKTYESRKNISINFNGSYGFRNKDVNGRVFLNRMYNPFNRGFFQVRASRDFSYIFEGDAWINMLARSNRYLNQSFGAMHGLEIFNGMSLFTELDMSLRKSLSDYKTVPLADDWYENFVPDNTAPDFAPYNALYGKLRLQYTPAQKFIREPKEKIILGSKWPTFYTTWRMGIPGVLGSEANFHYLEFGLDQDVKMGTLGIMKYNVKTGNFIEQKNLQMVDYQYQRRGDPLMFLNPNEAFQALDSSFPVFDQFWQGHALHEFNGALLNKIPLLKKLKLREVAGGGFLIAPERNLRYAEVFAGIEKVLEINFLPFTKFKLGVYVVGSGANQFRNPMMFKIGITTWDRFKNKWM
ncbi:MAG TPA: DUF5686 and carboxypeptidase regulatory-like domain-containing protein [Phnomibacter sp.]|nr:DUF5686 and carboxypeptidase regulatory-like domain-containing protein [Phnomibacter sp.]